MKQIGYAIIGCGMISQFHATAIAETPNARLVGVYDAMPYRCEQFVTLNGGKVYESLDHVWADEEVDAVCICTPSGLHFPQALAALEHGKHVLVEKPMALNLADCDTLIDSAKERNLTLGVVSQMRFSPGIQQVKQAMDAKILGKLICADLYMKFHRSQDYYDSSDWRGTWAMDGGGALMNQGIHGVDLLQYLAGPVDNVFARAKTLARKIEVEDTLSAITEFESGAIGVIQATTSLHSGFSRRIELCGEKGTIILEEDKILLWDVSDDEGLDLDTQGASEVRSSSDPGQISSNGHARQIGNFTAAILGKETILIDGNEGRKAVQIILSAYQSSRENRPVTL